jgi:hypothetical protein
MRIQPNVVVPRPFAFHSLAELAAGYDSTSSSTFVDATTAYSTWTFTPLEAKTYLLHISLSCYMTGGGNAASFRLMVNDGSGYTAVAGQPVYSASKFFNTMANHERIEWWCPVTFASTVSHTFKLQWKTGGGTVTTDGNDMRCAVFMG